MLDAAELLASLVAVPSINPEFRTSADHPDWFGEAAVADTVATWLRDAGLEVSLDPVMAGRPNVVARLRDPTATRRMIWEGHLDTVQVSGMSVAPFDPAVRDGRLYGRGAVDDKGCLTAFMLALAALAKDPARELDITFVAAVDEEFHQRGILHHLKRLERFDGGIAGEPTSLQIVSACKGCVRWDIDIVGLAAHSSRPEEGIDAIAVGTKLAVHLESRFTKRLSERHHPLVGAATLVCTMIEGGEGPNTIPSRCRLKYDRRTLPGETGKAAWDEIAAEVAVFADAHASGTTITMHEPFIDCPSMEVAGDSLIVGAAQAALRASGHDASLIGVPFGSDACQMNPRGIPTVVFGPGSIEQAHTADEYVEISQVERAAFLLTEIARRFAHADT